MKFHFIVAAAVALLCAAAPIATAAYDDADVVQLNVIEVEQEEGFLNQALNYLSEVETKTQEEVLAETQSGKKSEGEDDNKKSSSKDNNNKSKDKKEKSPEPAPSKKDREPKEPRPTRKPKEEREPNPTKKPKEERTPKPTREPKPPTPKPTKEERTPKPTREPKPTPKPTRRVRTPRPTPRPTRKPTISRSSQRAIDKWIHREWREDECDVRRRLRRLMSYSCRHLEDIVCTQRRRWLSQEAIDVCEKVGLPVSYRSENSEDLYSEDAEFDYELMYVADEE